MMRTFKEASCGSQLPSSVSQPSQQQRARAAAAAGVPTFTPLLSTNSTLSQTLRKLGPNTTLHQVTDHHATASSATAGYPADYRIESWLVFGPDGTVTSLGSNTTNSATGALIYRVRTVDGSSVQTTVATGETQTISGPIGATAAALMGRLLDAIDQTARSVNAGTTHTVSELNGRRVYVVDSTWTGGIDRTYVDASEYRAVRTEHIGVDTSGGQNIIQSTDTPVLEVLDGQVRPWEPAGQASIP
jgi:hypothetical protein